MSFKYARTSYVKETRLLQMEVNLKKTDRRWARLPRHFWGIAGRDKPGANVLANFRDEASIVPANEKQFAEERQVRDNALAALQNYGLGRVLYLGVDSTWRWRYRIGDTYHHRFWSQIIRWAASDKPQTRFGTRAPVYAEGENVDVFVRLDAETIRSVSSQIDIEAHIVRLRGPGNEEEPAALI